MSTYILDTDIVGFVQQAHPTVLQYLRALSPADGVATTIITMEEDIGGWLPACRRARLARRDQELKDIRLDS